MHGDQVSLGNEQNFTALRVCSIHITLKAFHDRLCACGIITPEANTKLDKRPNRIDQQQDNDKPMQSNRLCRFFILGTITREDEIGKNNQEETEVRVHVMDVRAAANLQAHDQSTQEENE